MDVDDIQEFTYPGSKMTVDGNVEMEEKERIRKARHAFSLLSRHGSRINKHKDKGENFLN